MRKTKVTKGQKAGYEKDKVIKGRKDIVIE